MIFRVIHHDEDEVICPICLEEPILPRMDKCGHIFCLSCIITMCKYKDSVYALCPFCKSHDINAINSKRVSLKKMLPIKIGEEITFKLLAKGKQSKFPDFYYNLVELLPKAPLAQEPSSMVTYISVDTDSEVLKIIKNDLDTLEENKNIIIERCGKEIKDEIAKLLTNELTDFETNLKIYDEHGRATKPEKSLDCFNFIIDVEKQIERFDLFYQNLDRRFVLLEPDLSSRLITTYKKSVKGLRADLSGTVLAIRTIKVTPLVHKETNLLNIPLGAMVTFVTIDIEKLRYKYAPNKKYEDAVRYKNILMKDLEILNDQRQKSQAKQNKLRLEGVTFTPMAESSGYKTTPPRANDESPSSYNLCMFGLECDDPDDDYPHDVMCYRYHDAYRRKEFHENFFTEDDPLI